MFRGSENFAPGRFDEIMQKAGASSNAYTSDDRTVYHETFAKEDLDEIMRLEADRFQRLKFSEEQLKPKPARFSANTIKIRHRRLLKCMKSCAKLLSETTHTATRRWVISKTLKIIRINTNMRGRFSIAFIAPKIRRLSLSAISNKRKFRQWSKNISAIGNAAIIKQRMTAEKPQDAARSKHIDWASPTLPYVSVAYRAPAFSETEKDNAALDLLSAIVFGENSDLYQKLVLQEQKAVWVAPDFDNQD